MISFNSRIVTIGALVIIVYILYQNKSENKNITAEESLEFGYDGVGATYSMKIPAGKKYKDFSWYEKLIYNLKKNDMNSLIRDEIEKE